jgi:ATP-dependent RNA helicase DDX35
MSQFWRPHANTIDRDDNGYVVMTHRNQHMSISEQRSTLPIANYRDNILYALEKFQTVVITAETGSGKSTQIPQYLHEAGWTQGSKCIVCTQPRRIAATTVASRVATEFGCALGNEVGYAVRFDAQCDNEKTVIKYCTDGLLLRETMDDPLLSKYSAVMVDEAHERSLQSDLVMGLLKKIQRKRKDLRIIVASATVDAVKLKEFFETNVSPAADPSQDTACIISVEGRTYPVDLQYLEHPVSNYLRGAVETVLEINKYEDKGDILVFLPGAEEIDSAIALLEEWMDTEKSLDRLLAIPLYSSLPSAMQLKAFETAPQGMRKAIFATNIAETSVTIPGVRFVVDCGFVKMKYFNVESGIDALITCPISKASARQRAGRAGRMQEGKCFRLMTEKAFESLQDHTTPEMQRTDISWAVLQLKALGIDDVLHFDFLSPPPAESMIYSLELLYSLGAIDDNCKLTRIGEQMAEMPIEPRLAKSLLSSFDLGCSEELLSIAAMCSVEYPFISVRNKANAEAKQRLLDCVSEFAAADGDHMTLLNIYNAFEDIVKSGSGDGGRSRAAAPKGVGPQGINGTSTAGSSSSSGASSWCDSLCLQYRILSRAQEVRGHLRRMLKRFAPEGAAFASCGQDSVAIRKCLIAGFFANAAQLGSDGQYYTVRGKNAVTPHPTSVLARFGAPPEWVIFNDVIHSKSAMIREVTRIEPTWLIDIASHYYMLKSRK